jgi:hypothetical protein
VADVLLVPAFEFGDPMVFGVDVVADDSSLHDGPGRREVGAPTAEGKAKAAGAKRSVEGRIAAPWQS